MKLSINIATIKWNTKKKNYNIESLYNQSIHDQSSIDT